MPHTCPANRTKTIDLYFMEHRAKLIDIAAFLDRVDRSDPADSQADDFRLAAFRSALTILTDTQPEKARRVLEAFSDHTTDPIPSAAGLKGAHGAPPTPPSPPTSS